MAVITLTRLYDLLSAKLDKETAENLTTFIESKIKDEVENKSQILASKEDISLLNSKIEKSNADNIKWMFIFWVGQVIATFGFILLFLKN